MLFDVDSLTSKMGVNDQAYIDTHGLYDDIPTLIQRYDNMKTNFDPGVRIYNVYHNGLEITTVSSSSDPNLQCPAGSVRIPNNASEMAQKNYRKYRCIDESQLTRFQYETSLDVQYGIEPAVVMWCTNPQYINEGCNTGCACVVRYDALDDWHDYVNVIVQEIGNFKHYIVYNENAASQWFDMTPIINIYEGYLSDADVDIWIEWYAHMFLTSLQAIGNSGKIYVSTDGLWEPPGTPSGAPYHMGTKRLLDGFWNILNTQVDWYLAVHPYKNVTDPSMYSMATLPNVFDYQANQIMNRFNVSIDDVYNYPPVYMAASEQGWFLVTGYTQQQVYSNLCVFHDFMVNHYYMLWATHFHLQMTDVNDQYGFIKDYNDITMSNPTNDPAYDIWAATNPDNWNVNSNNYCCVNFELGCP